MRAIRGISGGKREIHMWEEQKGGEDRTFFTVIMRRDKHTHTFKHTNQTNTFLQQIHKHIQTNKLVIQTFKQTHSSKHFQTNTFKHSHSTKDIQTNKQTRLNKQT